MEESTDFSKVLLEDMSSALKRLTDDHPRERRTCVRAAFATVEGHLAGLCQELLAKAGGGLSETERMALREETYRVDGNGEIRTIPAHLPLKQRIRLVTGIVKKLHPEYEIDFRSAGWQSLMLGLDVRHRLTHPKNRKDMDVESSELEATINGVFWFLMQVISSGEDGITAYLEKNRARFTLADLGRHGPGIPLSQLLGVTRNIAPPGEAGPTGLEPSGDGD